MVKKMDDKLMQVVKGLLPEGSEVVKIYKGDSGEVKVDAKLPGMGELTCSLKKNHAGELYLD